MNLEQCFNTFGTENIKNMMWEWLIDIEQPHDSWVRRLTILSSIKEMFPKIAAKNSLFQDSALFQFSPGRSGEDEAPEEGDQLAVLPQHRLGRLWGRFRGGGVSPGEVGQGVGVVGEVEVVGDLVTDHLHTLAREESNLESPFSSPPDGLLWGGHVNDRDHISHLNKMK